MNNHANGTSLLIETFSILSSMFRRRAKDCRNPPGNKALAEYYTGMALAYDAAADIVSDESKDWDTLIQGRVLIHSSYAGRAQTEPEQNWHKGKAAGFSAVLSAIRPSVRL